MAADRGSLMRRLASALGQGVPKDYVLAYMRLNLAAAQGELADEQGKLHVSRDRDEILGLMSRA
jgi:hypothetical protein